MRIISGKFKNRKLNFPKNAETRPLKDIVRENIFNVLKHSKNIKFEIKNSKIIDIYAGTGSFGIECLSHDASEVFFIENNKEALKNLEENIKNLKIEKKVFVKSDNIFKFLKSFNLKKKFDLVFLDPPYKDKSYIDLFKILKEKKLVSNNYIIILHREKNTDKNINKYIKIIENRIYGRSEIFFGRII